MRCVAASGALSGRSITQLLEEFLEHRLKGLESDGRYLGIVNVYPSIMDDELRRTLG